MGYTVSANTPYRLGSNTEFQTWGSWIANGVANCGLVQTSDTGQINWSTVTTPTGTYTYQGYEVYRFNDALQNTTPIYLKIEYGSASSNTIPSLRFTVASGSTGNGTMTGFVPRDTANANAWIAIYAAGAFANNTLLSYICGDTNRIVIALAVRGTNSIASYPMLFSLERTKDANGNDTADGVLGTWVAGGTPVQGQFVFSPVAGSLGTETDALGVLTPQRGGGTTGSNTTCYPIFHQWGGGAHLNPGLNLLAYWHSEITAGTANTFTYYGASHTYMPLGNTGMYNFSPRGNTSIALMMRWE